MKNRFATFLRYCLLFLIIAGVVFQPQYPVYALTTLTVNPITWNVIGLDSNNVNVGPNHFPVGVRVCNTGAEAATNVTATWNWVGAHTYINLRSGTYDPSINVGTLNAGACADAYFEVEVTRNASAYDTTAGYRIDVTAGNVTGTISTPTPREFYVEHLISQARNTVNDIKLNGVSVPAGGTMTLMVGQTYNITINGATATQGYNQLEEFINFPNTIFQVLSVATTYSADNTTPVIPAPMQNTTMLYGNACVWENDPNSPNYRSCVGGDDKNGGTVNITYSVKILQVPGAPLVNPEPLSTLIYDFSGSSFHYNADYDVSTRYAYIVNASVEKSFSPKTITPGSNSTLTFTINNPGPSSISDVNFTDDLPTNVTLANSSVAYSGCGSPLPASGSLTDPLTFTNITVAGLSACTITVTVTVTSITNASYPNTTSTLKLGTTDTLDTASDTLVVSSAPTPPTSCTTRTTVATWNFNSLATGLNIGPFTGTTGGTATSATATYGAGTGSASAIANNTSSVLAGDPMGTINPVAQTPADSNSWGIHNGWPASGVPTGTTTPYFQFQVNAIDYGGVSISSIANLQGNWTNGDNWYVLASTDGTTWTQRGTGAWANNTFKTTWGTVSNNTSTPVNAATTYFRIFFVGAGNKTDETVFLDNVTITGCPNPPPPTISKSFGTDPIVVGGTSTLTFTIANTTSGATALTGLSFTDVLPGGLVINTPSGLTNSCGGTATATAGTSTISLSGGTINAAASCTITVSVKGNASGIYTNTSTNITSIETGPNTSTTPNVGFGQDTLTVIAPPVIAKSFTANPIFVGNTTTLTFSINNPNTSTTLTGISFTDTLPTGLDVVVAAPSAQCGGTLTLNNANPDTIVLSGGSLAAGATCTFSVTVTGTTASLTAYTNTVTVNSTNGGTGNTDTANVLVKTPAPAINLLKQVGPTISGPWTPYLTITTGADVYYRFTVENTGDVALNPVTVTDNIPAINTLVAACTWFHATYGVAPTYAYLGDAAITPPLQLPVATLGVDPSAYCVVGPITAVSGSHPNTATGTSTYTTPDPDVVVTDTSTATYATLTVDKDTSTPAIAPNGTVVYTIVVVNSGNMDLTNFQVTDTLPDFNGATAGTGYTVASVTAPGYTVNGAFDGSTNTNLLAGTDTLADNVTATITITLTVTNATAGMYDNTASVSTTQTGSINDDGLTANDPGTPGSGADPETDEDVAVFGASPTKSIVNTSEPSTGFVAATERVTIGEMVRYRLATLIPQGSFTNVQLLDNLPTGLQFLNDNTATVAFVCNGGAGCMTSSALAGAGLVVSGSSSAVSPIFVVPGTAISAGPFTSGTDVTFSVGNITNSDADIDSEFIVVEFNALVLNVNAAATINQGLDNSAGSTGASNSNNRQNDVTLLVNGAQVGATSPNVTVAIAEPAITSITKSVSPATGPYLPGAALIYTLSFSNVANGNNAATAFDIVLTDTFNANLTLGTVTITSSQGTSGVDTCAGGTSFTTGSSTAIQTVTANISCLDPGETVDVTVAATISAGTTSGTTISNTGSLTYTSLPGAQGNCATAPFSCSGVGGTGSGTGERNGSGGSGVDTTVLNNYAVTSNTINSAVAFGSITITKDAVPNDAQNFAFTGTGPSSFTFGGGFSLDDDADGTLSNTQTFTPLPAGSYSVTEGAIAGWSLTGLTCIDPDTGSTTNLGTATATIDLDAGESITCTYTNTKQTTLTLQKTVVNDNGGAAIDTAWTLSATQGATTISGVEGNAAITNAVVAIGTWTLSESGGPAGYTAGTWSCSGAADANPNDGLTLAAGEVVTCTITNDDNAPSLTLVKTVTNDDGGIAAATDWTLTATGALGSPTNLSGTTPVASGAGFKADTYTLGESGPAGYTAGTWSCTNGVTVTSSQITLGLGQSTTCTINNNDNLVTFPQLTLTKTASGVSFTVGVAASYTLTLENTGTVATTAVSTITDTIPAGLTPGAMPAGCSAVGQDVTCTVAAGLAVNASTNFVIPVTPTITAVPSVTNSASVTGGGDPTCPATARCTPSVTTPVNTPQLTLTKTPSGASFTVGVAASYTLTLENTGTVATTAVSTITDTIPAGLTPGAMPAGCSAVGQAVTCTVAAGLAVNATTSFVIPVTPTIAAVPSVINSASVSGGGDPTCPATTARCVPSVTTPVNTPQLTLTKTASGASFTVGVAASYTLTLENTGTVATTAVSTITDTIPAGLTPGAMPAGCSAVGQAVTCTVAAGLAVNATTSFVIPVTPTITAVPSVINSASVTGGGDPTCPATTARCVPSVTTPVNTPQLTLTKTPSGASFTVGVAASYTLTLENTGTVATTAVSTITDTLPAGLTPGAMPAGCSAVGQAVTCTVAAGLAVNATTSFVIPVTPTITAVPSVTNSASVSGGGDPTCPATTARCVPSVTTPVNVVNLGLAKTDGTVSVVAGGTTTYTLTVTNNGDTSAFGTITIVDVLPTGLSVTNGAITTGGTNGTDWTCNAATNVITCTSSTAIAASGTSVFNFTVNVDLAATGTLVNRAQVGGGGDPTNPNPPTTTTAGQCTATNTPNEGCALDTDSANAPDLGLTKTNGTTNVTAGGTTTYTLTVTNSGTAVTSGTTMIVDVLPAGMSIADGAITEGGTNAADWACIAATNVITCTSSIAIAGSGGTSVFNFTVNVDATASGTLLNRAQVGGGGDPNNPNPPTTTTTGQCTTTDTPNKGCATDSDSTNFVNLGLAKTDGVASVVAGTTTTYTLTVTNSGNIASSGTVTIVDVLPTGLSVTNGGITTGGTNGADWTCTAASNAITCTSTTVIAASGGASVFSFTVNVDVTASGTLINRAQVGGGGDPTNSTPPTTTTAGTCTGTNAPAEGCATDTNSTTPSASINGVVFNDADLNGSKAAGESGIVGVIVNLYDSTGTTLIATTITGPGGAYSFTNLVPGSYTVVEIDPAGYVSSTPNSVPVTVASGATGTVNFGDYQLPNTALSNINGVVFNDANSNGIQDAGELPIPNVTVELKNNLGVVIATTTTNASGAYAFTNLTAGTYTVVETDLAGYVSTTLNNVAVNLSAGTNATINFGDQIVVGNPLIADPAVTKFGSPTSAIVGDTVVYTITVGNNGNINATNVVLTDTKPIFLDIISISISPNPGLTPVISGNTFTINFGTVAPTDFYTITVLTRVNNLGVPPGGANNAAITTSSGTDNPLNNASAAQLTIAALGTPQTVTSLPATGFAPHVTTALPAQPQNLMYAATNVVLEIPSLGVKIPIVGVSKKNGAWDVSWLGKQAGWLEGTAFPSWSGNSVLTSHVYDSNGLPGSFVNLGKLKYGDKIIIHAYGQKYIFEVQTNQVVGPNDTSALKHEQKPWLTLVTCKEYDEKTNTYKQRVVVRAVLVSVDWDK